MKRFLPSIAFSLCLCSTAAYAVILFGTDDPSVNTTAPGGTLLNSGWQYEGTWGGFLGTPIAPNFFISAAHIGQAGTTFSFQSSTYTLVRSFALATSDLLIWQVNETFPFYAPMYTKSGEVGRHLVVFGRGTERGSEIIFGGRLRGWNWNLQTGDTHVERWGENNVRRFIPFEGHDLLYATFEQSAGPNESQLSAGDSGGGVFINDGGVWKLAGINYSVDDLYTSQSDATRFNAAVFDARDYYTKDDQNNFVLIAGDNPVPTGFYASRISSERAWIYSVIDPASDLDGDGIPNLMEYALHLDPLAPDAAGLPKVGREENFLTLTYTKVTTASDINYIVEQSSDLKTWSVATTQEEIVATNGDIQTIKAKIDIGSATKLFARLRVTRP